MELGKKKRPAFCAGLNIEWKPPYSPTVTSTCGTSVTGRIWTNPVGPDYRGSAPSGRGTFRNTPYAMRCGRTRSLDWRVYTKSRTKVNYSCEMGMPIF